MNIDLTKTTQELFSKKIVSKDELNFAPKYKNARSKLDYDWHTNYTYKRQLVQDEIIDKLLEPSLESQDKPIAFFTCGGMGAGKTHLLKLFNKLDLFPLNNFSHIDPDKIKTYVPEIDLYKEHCHIKASSMVHHESSHIADIMMFYSVINKYNMIIDGTLSDSDYFKIIFKMLKDNDYTVILMYVDVDEDVALNRCMLRYWDTHRFVPKKFIINSLKKSKESYDVLKNDSDYHFHLIHNYDVPVFKSKLNVYDFCNLFANKLSDSELKTRCDSLDSGFIPYPEEIC